MADRPLDLSPVSYIYKPHDLNHNASKVLGKVMDAVYA